MKTSMFVMLTFAAFAGVGLFALAANPPSENKEPLQDFKAPTEEPKGNTGEGVLDEYNPTENAYTMPLDVEEFGAGTLSATDSDTDFNESSRSPADVYDHMDPAFSKFVDLSLLEEALARPDASLLTEVALGLAEGERILVRSHRSNLSSDDMMARSVKLAVRIGDKTTLERITKAASSNNKPQWAKLVTDAKDFGGVSRDGPSFPLTKIDVSVAAVSQAVQRACDLATVMNQKIDLESLKKTVAEKVTDEKIRAHLFNQIDSTLAGVAEKPSSLDQVFDEFYAVSRNDEVNLMNTRGAKETTNLLSSMAQGNEASGGLRTLSLNKRTGQVRGSGFVRHRQVAGYTPRIYNPFSGRHEGGDPIVVYDWTWDGNFAFNARNQTGHVNLDLGRGVRLDTRRIERILQGDLSALLEMVPNGDFVTKKFRNEYDHIRNSYYRDYGGGNVYFASKRFVDWATPETAGKWVITAVASGGTAAVAQAMSEAKRKSYEEFNDIVNWLRSKGVREAESVARQILEGQRVDWPYLAVKWQTVGYFSRNFVANRPVGPEIRVTHAAFVLIWKGSTPGAVGPRPGPAPERPVAGAVVELPSGGRVSRRDASSWVEIGSDGNFVCQFRQLSEDIGLLVLREDTRRFTLTIPKQQSGVILWQFDGEQPQPWGRVTWR